MSKLSLLAISREVELKELKETLNAERKTTAAIQRSLSQVAVTMRGRPSVTSATRPNQAPTVGASTTDNAMASPAEIAAALAEIVANSEGINVVRPVEAAGTRTGTGAGTGGGGPGAKGRKPSSTMGSTEESSSPKVKRLDIFKFQKYENMKKMLPERSIRERMIEDGITTEDIDAFFAGLSLGSSAPTSLSNPSSSLAAGSSASNPTSNEQADPKLAKYIKMKKMLPDGPIRQQMTIDGFSEDDINTFLSTGKMSTRPSLTKRISVLEDPKFAKYVKMKKMLPEGAVRQRMAQDGMSQEDIELLFSGDGTSAPAPAPGPPAVVKEPPPPGKCEKQKITPQSKMKALYWAKLQNASITKTLWNDIDEVAFSSEDIRLVEDLLSAPVVTKKTTGAGAKSKPSAVALFDGRRTQNVLIALGKMRMSPQSISAMVVEVMMILALRYAAFDRHFNAHTHLIITRTLFRTHTCNAH